MRTCNPRTACLMHWAAGNRGRFRHSRSPRRPPVLLMTVVAAFLVLKDAGVEARERAWLPPMVARVRNELTAIKNAHVQARHASALAPTQSSSLT